jgi:hypothetical protein
MADERAEDLLSQAKNAEIQADNIAVFLSSSRGSSQNESIQWHRDLAAPKGNASAIHTATP